MKYFDFEAALNRRLEATVNDEERWAARTIVGKEEFAPAAIRAGSECCTAATGSPHQVAQHLLPDPRLFASVCVERPNRALVRGLPKFEWLKILKNSDRQRGPTFSARRNCRCTPISACAASKPRSRLRPRLPCCPIGGVVKAALLKILPPEYPGPKSSRGAPDATFGRG